MKLFKNSTKSLIETFLDFAFFLCIVPFRINRLGEVQVWLPQKILAIIFASLDIFGSFSKFRYNLGNSLDNPIGYFQFVWSLALNSMHFTFFLTLWTKKDSIVKAVRIFKKSFSECGRFTKLPLNATFGYCICIVGVIMALLPSLKGSSLIPNPSPGFHWSPLSVFKAHVAHSRFMFFISEETVTNVTQILDIDDPLSTIDITMGVGHFIVYTVRYFGAYFLDIFMIFSAIMLWLGVNEFTKEVMENEDIQALTAESNSNGFEGPPPFIRIEPIESLHLEVFPSASQSPQSHRSRVLDVSSSIIEKYGDLKQLAKAINCALGPVLFCYVFEAIFYYATNLSSIFTAKDWHSRLLVAYFLLGCASVFGFSADVTRKMDSFRLWLVSGEVRKWIGPEKLVALVHDTQSKAIGVSALGIFTIDYPLIFNIVTTTVTFFLIVVQFVPKKC